MIVTEQVNHKMLYFDFSVRYVWSHWRLMILISFLAHVDIRYVD